MPTPAGPCLTFSGVESPDGLSPRLPFLRCEHSTTTEPQDAAGLPPVAQSRPKGTETGTTWVLGEATEAPGRA